MLSAVKGKATINPPCLRVAVSQLLLSKATAISKANDWATVGNRTTSLVPNGNCYRFNPDLFQEYEKKDFLSLIRLGWQELVGPPHESPVFSPDSSLKCLLPHPFPTQRINGESSAPCRYHEMITSQSSSLIFQLHHMSKLRHQQAT